MVLVDPLLEDARLHAARSIEEEDDPSPAGILARDLLRGQGLPSGRYYAESGPSW